MEKRPTFEEYEKEALKDPAFKAEYEKLRLEFDLIKEFIKARNKAGLSQMDLAHRLGMQKRSIIRLEGGGYACISVNKLSRIAQVLGYDLKISLQAKKRKLKV